MAAKQIPEIHGDLGVTQDSQGKPEKSSLLPGRLGERRNLASPGSIQDRKGEKVAVVGPEHFILEGLDHRMRPRVIAPKRMRAPGA